MVLGHPDLDSTELSSLQFWYGAAPMSVARLEEALKRIGPVMAQLFGQTEAPMMISMMPPEDHLGPDGMPAHGRLSSAGRPAPLVQVAILDEQGASSRVAEGRDLRAQLLVMAGYYKNPEATARPASWLAPPATSASSTRSFLHIVDRAKDMIITGGYNVYSTEVEQALLAHPDVQDAAAIGLPDEKWGEKVIAVVQPYADQSVDPDGVRLFVRERIGGVRPPRRCSSGAICRGRRWARCSRPTSARDCSRTPPDRTAGSRSRSAAARPERTAATTRHATAIGRPRQLLVLEGEEPSVPVEDVVREGEEAELVGGLPGGGDVGGGLCCRRPWDSS